MVMLNSLYKLSWKWLSSITKMGEIGRTCAAPMFSFGNWWQSLWTNGCLELYSKDLSVGTSWSPSVGFKEFIWWPRWYSRFYPKIGHVRVELIASMSWRRRLCEHSCLPSRHHPNEESWKDTRLIKNKYNEWFKLINTQSVEDVPSGIKWSHGMVSIVHYALCTNPWSLWSVFVGLGVFPWACEDII